MPPPAAQAHRNKHHPAQEHTPPCAGTWAPPRRITGHPAQEHRPPAQEHREQGHTPNQAQPSPAQHGPGPRGSTHRRPNAPNPSLAHIGQQPEHAGHTPWQARCAGTHPTLCRNTHHPMQEHRPPGAGTWATLCRNTCHPAQEHTLPCTRTWATQAASQDKGGRKKGERLEPNSVTNPPQSCCCYNNAAVGSSLKRKSCWTNMLSKANELKQGIRFMIYLSSPYRDGAHRICPSAHPAYGLDDNRYSTMEMMCTCMP